MEPNPLSGPTSPSPVPLSTRVQFSTAEIKKRIDEMFDETHTAAIPMEN